MDYYPILKEVLHNCGALMVIVIPSIVLLVLNRIDVYRAEKRKKEQLIMVKVKSLR